MIYGPLDGAIEKIIKSGIGITEYFLGLANFRVLKNGNGPGYVLYQKDKEYFLFMKKGKFLELSMRFENPKIIGNLEEILN